MAQAQELTWGAGLDRAVGTDRRARPDPASARPRAGTGQDTLTSLLDRLETGGLIIRSLDPHDRRARIPQVTTAGRRTQARITRARDHTEAELLTTFSPQEQHLLRDLLTRLAADQRGDCLHASGSCIYCVAAMGGCGRPGRSRCRGLVVRCQRARAVRAMAGITAAPTVR
jgi:hypothetical protein